MASIPVMQTTSVSHNSRGGVGMFSKFGKMTTYYHSCFTPRKEILRTLPIESFEQKAQKLLDSKLLHKTSMTKRNERGKEGARKGAMSVQGRRKLLSVTHGGDGSLSRSAAMLDPLSSFDSYSPSHSHDYSSSKPFSFNAVDRQHFYKHEVSEKKQVPGVGHYKPNINSLLGHSFQVAFPEEIMPEVERAKQLKAMKAAVPINFSKKLEKTLSDSFEMQLRMTSPKQRHLEYLKATQFKKSTKKTRGENSQSQLEAQSISGQQHAPPTLESPTHQPSLFAQPTQTTSKSNLSPNASLKNTLKGGEDIGSDQRAKTMSVAPVDSPLYRDVLNTGLNRIRSLTLKTRPYTVVNQDLTDASSYSFRFKKRFPKHLLVKEKDKSEIIVSARSPDKARAHTPRTFIGQLRARPPFVTQKDPPNALRFQNIEKLPGPLSKRKHVRGFDINKLTPRQKQLFGEVPDQPDYNPNKEYVMPKRVIGILGFKGITRRLPQKSIYKDAYQCESINYDKVLTGLDKEAHRKERVASPRFESVPGRDGKAMASYISVE